MNGAAGSGAWLHEKTTLEEVSVGTSTVAMEVMGMPESNELDGWATVCVEANISGAVYSRVHAKARLKIRRVCWKVSDLLREEKDISHQD